MSHIVNPYVDWLGIPESVSRPNYYQLLGIAPFEHDEKKIKGAYYRRVAQVSVHRSGSNAEACALVLVELAEARECLTDDKSRKAYASRIGKKYGVQPIKEKQRRRSRSSPPSENRPGSAASEADQHLQRMASRSPQLRRQIATEAQIAQYRSQSHRSPFGMFSVMKTPTEILTDLASTRGLTDLQARLLRENSAHEVLVGPYLLEQELRKGSWGRVFLATRMSTGELASLRLLPTTFETHRKALPKLIDQASQIDPRRIQRTIEIGLDGDQPYIVSEYISGEDLWSLIHRTGPLLPQQAVYCVGRLVEALDAALKVGLTHLELRPSKVLVNRAGDIHLRDLPLANVTSSRKRRESNFIELLNLLPPRHLHFMAPEILRNEASPTHQADIYSVGCILFFLLTGQHVLVERDPMKIATEHRRPVSPADLANKQKIPEPLQNCLAKMVANRLSDRFNSYESLHAALKSAYQRLKSDGVTPTQLWQNVDGYRFTQDELRQIVRRFHFRRAAVTGTAVASLAAVVSFAGLHFSKAESPQPLLLPVAQPVPPEESGPNIVRDNFTEVPVVEAHDVFSVR